MRVKNPIVTISNALFALSCVYIVVKYLLAGDYVMALLGPASALFLLIPPLAQRLFHLQLPPKMHACTLGFSFMAFNLGTALRWYDIFAPYDRMIHGISGIFFTLVGFCIYYRLKEGEVPFSKGDWLLQMCFALFFSMFIAAFWEMWEYTCYLVFGYDCQLHETTGVHNTMQDIISCFAGSLVMCGIYLAYIKKNIKTFFIDTIEAFCVGMR